MEGKTLVLSVLVMSLFMAQIQVDAKTCCPNTNARYIYNVCRLRGGSKEQCARLSGCVIIPNITHCPFKSHDNLENTGDAVNEYCKVGCVSTVCGALSTLQNSDASEIVGGAVEDCADACLTVCTKGLMNAVETA